jgi:hypothetical protein
MPGNPAIPPAIKDDDELDPSFDIEDEGTELDDAFMGRDWPDDEPLAFDEFDVEDLQVVQTEEIDLDEVDDAPTEDDLSEEEVFFNVTLIEDNLDDERTIVPWSTTARLPQHDLELPVVLDVAASTSRWIGGPGGLTTVELEGITLEVALIATPGSPAEIRLGRDAISGKLLVKP